MSAMTLVQLSDDDADDLLHCARAGDLEDLKETAESLAQQYETGEAALFFRARDTVTGNSCLHYASANGHEHIVSFIVGLYKDERATAVTQTNQAGNTALHYAALNGHLTTAKALLAGLSDDEKSNAVTLKNNAGHDAAFEAESNSKEDVVTYLLEVLDDADATAASSGKVEDVDFPDTEENDAAPDSDLGNTASSNGDVINEVNNLQVEDGNG